MGIREAWQVLWKRNSPPQRRPTGHKFMPLAWPDFRLDTPQWQIYDFPTYVGEGFNANTLIYSAILYKARALSGIPLRAYTGDPDNPEPLAADHPLAQLCSRPNPHMAWRFFQMLRVTYLNLAGNSFTFCDRPAKGGLPTALWALRPDRVFIVPRPEKKGLLGYVYTPEGTSSWLALPIADRIRALHSGSALAILPQDMMHTKLPNPGDDLEGLGYGLSPISPLAFSADVDNMVTKFLKLFFQKGAMPAALLSFTDALDDDIVARARERWNEIYGGYEEMAKGIAVLDQGGQYQRVGFTFEELGFDGIDERNESRIMAPFGVPSILIGARLGLKHGTYENFKAARTMCWEDTLIPEKDLFENEDAYYLQDRDGRDFVQYDLASVPALQQDKVAQVGAAYQMWQMGTPADLAYQTVGLQVEQVEGGDVGFLPMGIQTVAQVLEPPAPVPPQLEPFAGVNNPPAEEAPAPEALPEQDNEGAAEAEEEGEETQGKGRKYSEDQPRDEGGRFGSGGGGGSGGGSGGGDAGGGGGSSRAVRDSGAGISREGTTTRWQAEDQVRATAEIEVPAGVDSASWSDEDIAAYVREDFASVGLPTMDELVTDGRAADFMSPDDIEDIEVTHISRRGDRVSVSLNITPTDAAGERWLEQVGESEARETYYSSGRKPHHRKAAFTPERKEVAWKRVDAIARRWEPDFASAARAALESDRRHILAIVQGGAKAARRYKATVDWRQVEAGLGEYLGLASPENWREEFTPVVAGVMEDQGAKWAAELGVAWNVRNVAGEKWFEQYMLKFAQPIDDTTKAWLDYMLQRAMAEGWSVDQMSKALEAMFDVWLGDKELTDEEAAWFGERLPQARRELIARTSTLAASNYGTQELFKEWGVKQKEWLSTMDPPRAREDHMAMNGQVVGIDEEFVNPETGARFRHPGDPSAGAAEVCNCRCTELPVLPD